MKELADYIRSHREELLAVWREELTLSPPRRHQGPRELEDHMPQVLGLLADALEHADVPMVELEALAHSSADHRSEQQYDIRELTEEYRVLRRIVLQRAAMAPSISEKSKQSVPYFVAMNEALDRVMGHAAKRFMEQQNRARDVFIGILGHDLRGPLALVRTSAQTMQMRAAGQDEPHQKSLQRILVGTTRIEKMVADLLDFARGHLGGGIPIRRAQVELRALVAQTVEELCAVFPDRTLEVVKDDGAEPLLGQWDADRVRQALVNLLMNALDHGADPVRVHVEETADEVRLCVQNGGVIPPDRLPSLFRPFKREEGQQGLGLGLYIVCEIARAHGGAISVQSDAVDGTVFRLVLPRAESPPA